MRKDHQEEQRMTGDQISAIEHLIIGLIIFILFLGLFVHNYGLYRMDSYGDGRKLADIGDGMIISALIMGVGYVVFVNI